MAPKPITDAQLDEWENGHSAGDRNAAPYLRPLTPEQRGLAVADAMCRMNIQPGYNYSGAVCASAEDVKQGRTPYLDENDRLMAYDPTGEKAADAARRGQSWQAFRDAANGR